MAIQINNNYGPVIDNHDGGVVNLKQNSDGSWVSDDEACEQQLALVEKLKPIFYGIEDEARAFLASIRGMKPVLITEQVNRLVAEGKISELSRKRELYIVLHEANLYAPSEQNWCNQVK